MKRLRLRPWLVVAVFVLLGAVPATAAPLTLSWEDNSGDEQGFGVERKTGITGGGGFTPVALVGPNVETYTDRSLTVGTVYCYRVRAYNSSGVSKASNEACGRAVTFRDVSSSYWAWAYIEAVVARGITTGCAAGRYCPDGLITRAEMAVFLLKASSPPGYVPPAASGTKFDDVPASHWAAAWIEQLAAEEISAGCGAGNYCPENAVTRAEMAAFLLRTKYGPGYTPPPAAGSHFTDVPPSYWAFAWIEELVDQHVTAGCGPPLLYCPGSFVTRAQMAVFLVRALGLPIPF